MMYQLRQIPSEAQIKKRLKRILYGRNIFCPFCSSHGIIRYEKRYRCRSCRTKFSLLSCTWLSNVKLPLQEIWLILWCWTAQVPVKQTVLLSHKSEVTVRHWFDMFREHLPNDPVILKHLVQLDEAFFGGKNGHALFLGKEIGSRKLAYRIANTTNPNRTDAFEFLKHYIEPDTRLNTDGAAIYTGIDKWWPVVHTRDIHKKFEFEHTSEIEGMFGVLRTFIRRMYHHCTMEKFPDLVSEFCYRFSHPEMFESPQQYLQNTLRFVPTR